MPKLLEKDVRVLGCTGVLDELQDDIKQCIQDFRDAAIKVWMLTGDMGKTAEKIGIQTGLLTNDGSCE